FAAVIDPAIVARLPPDSSASVPAVPMFAVTVPLTGWVTPEPSVFKAVIDATPWTESTSAEAVPAVPIAGCLAAVLAPAGRGRLAALTGCVACQKVPVTAIELFRTLTGRPTADVT